MVRERKWHTSGSFAEDVWQQTQKQGMAGEEKELLLWHIVMVKV